MKRHISIWAIRLAATVLPLLIGSAGLSYADATIPNADISGASDRPIIKRYEGSLIISYDSHAYAELQIPLSPLKPSPIQGERDARNNRVYHAERTQDVDGTLTRLVYLIPENRSPLEVVRNYQDEIEALGGHVEFECKAEQCGGAANRAAYGGGDKMSLTQQFFYDSDLKDAPHSNGSCALTSSINDQHYLAAQIPQAGSDGWVIVQSFQLDAGTYCKALNGRAIAIVQVLEPKAREKKMVVVAADEMAKAIDHDGSISLYGIYFDTAKAELKPDSKPTLTEIAVLLENQPALSVLVVGHTDNQGSHDYNLDLSSKRANAVKAALVSKYGIEDRRLMAAGAGMMAPIATNDSEDGRAKNRRVVLVKTNE